MNGRRADIQNHPTLCLKHLTAQGGHKVGEALSTYTLERCSICCSVRQHLPDQTKLRFGKKGSNQPSLEHAGAAHLGAYFSH